eukprot:10873848-Alexandrium_andersonii.AAC.1
MCIRDRIDSGRQPALQDAMRVHSDSVWALLVRAPQTRPTQDLICRARPTSGFPDQQSTHATI